MANTSTNEIYAQIGAAKIFSQDVSANLGKTSSKLGYDAAYYENEAEQYDEGSKEYKKAKRKAKMANRANKAVSTVNKVVTSANDFLCKLMELTDIAKEKLIEWLAQFLKYNLPALEYSVKAVLLANIKQMTSCAIDPTIPDSWRSEGVLVNEKEIDPRGILNMSPFSQIGQYNYTVSSGAPLYTLSRSEDMNAFIWFTKTNGRFANPIIIGDKITDYFDGVSSSDTLYSLYQDKTYPKEKENRKFLPGTTFKHNESSLTIFLLEEVTDGGEYIINPVSSQWDSVNWYWQKKNSVKPVFNLSYSNGYNDLASLPRNNFTFKILPKPFQIGIAYVTDATNLLNNAGNAANSLVEKYVGNNISGLTTGYSTSSLSSFNISNLKPHTARFKETGEYDRKGKYSIDENLYDVKLVGKSDKISSYSISLKGKSNNILAYIWFDSKTHKFALGNVQFPTNKDDIGNDSNVLKGSNAFKVLTECYFGKTVYEFNFDYIWSFKLFDEKVIAANIVNDLMNINYKIHNPFKKHKSLSNTDQIYIDNYIDQLVQNIISEGDTDNEFGNCFYTFDNNEYKTLEQNTVNKIRQGTLVTDTSDSGTINEVYNLIDSYKTSSDLQSQITILNNAVNKASLVGNNSSSNSDSDSSSDTSSSDDSSSSILQKIIKFLTAEIVNAILTPKVLMLIQINKKLMENDPLSLDKNIKFDISDVLNSMAGIIKAVVREIVESIQKELLKMIMTRINEIMSVYLKLLSLEYAKKWIELLKLLINAYKKLMKRLKKRKSKGSSDSDIDNEIAAILAEGNYADILDNIEPNTNNC